jgi:hypothetical protein
MSYLAPPLEVNMGRRITVMAQLELELEPDGATRERLTLVVERVTDAAPPPPTLRPPARVVPGEVIRLPARVAS